MPKKKTIAPVLPDLPRLEVEPIRRIGYSPEEAAASLGLGLTNTYALIREGQLGAVHKGRKIIIPVDEIRAFLLREMTRGVAQPEGG